MGPGMLPLQDLQFEHTALTSLPVDENEHREVQRDLPGACFSLVDAQPLDGPEVVCLSQSALDLLGVKVDEHDPSLPKLLSLSATFSNCKTYAHCYCGHQFGSFAGQLGDGAATSIGEVQTADGRWELQFKGAGQTPFSRAGDGRKVLRSSLREFLASEAMHHLGIPTTRAASVCTSKSTVLRDPFYTGNAIHEPCAVILRMAPSFLRFGSLEIVKPTSNTGRKGPSAARPELLNSILDYLIFYHFRSIWDICGGGSDLQNAPSNTQKKEMYLMLYEEIVERTSKLCAQWQGVGFCHGVLNTDNMSMLGLTIDYGPYGWLDRYDEGHICNSSDDGGRYSFAKQPWAVQENLERLGEMITLAGADTQEVARVHRAGEERYTGHLHACMRSKLGLLLTRDEDDTLFTQLQSCMQQTGVDFSITFRNLALVEISPGDNGSADSGVQAFLDVVLPTCPDPSAMASKMRSKIDPRQLTLLQKLVSEQPAMIARLGLTCEEVAGEVLKNENADTISAQAPDEKEQQDEKAWRQWLGSYQKRLQEELSAGSKAEERLTMMNGANPKIVLRNWVAQVAIDAASKGDYASVKRILELLESPFKEWPKEEILLDIGGQKWPADQPPPQPLENLCVSCSS